MERRREEREADRSTTLAILAQGVFVAATSFFLPLPHLVTLSPSLRFLLRISFRWSEFPCCSCDFRSLGGPIEFIVAASGVTGFLLESLRVFSSLFFVLPPTHESSCPRTPHCFASQVSPNGLATSPPSMTSI